MPSYVLPQVLVFQEFTRAATALVQPLDALIMGEQFSLHRYSDTDEKETILVSSTYDSTGEVCYSFPGRPAGGVVDADYTKVFFDSALLRYFRDTVGVDSVINHVSPNKNRIRSDSVVFKTANGYTRDVSLLRDVQIGDVVRLVGSACDAPASLESTVTGFAAEVVPSDVDLPVIDVDNQATVTLTASSSQTSGDTNNVSSAASAALYNGLITGDVQEVYTIEVVESGGVNVAQLRVTSASGNDDLGVVTFDGAFGSPWDLGTRGATVTFSLGAPSGGTDDVFLQGQKFDVTVRQAFTRPTLASGGTYDGATTTTYIVTVSRGGKFTDTLQPRITVSTTTGVDVSGPTTVTASAVAVAVGNHAVTITFTGTGLCEGDRYTILATAESDGAVQTLILAHNLPSALRGACDELDPLSSAVAAPDLDLSLFIKKNIEVPALSTDGIENWTQSDTEVCLQPSIMGYDSSWTSGGEEQPLEVIDATVYIEHRDRISDNAATVGSINDVSAIPETFPGGSVIHPDNPLVFGVYNALLNSNGEDVKFIGIVSETGSTVALSDWEIALDKLVDRDDVYSIVPLTQDKQVLDSVLAHCESLSTAEKGRWRICWLNRPAVEVKAIYTADTNGAVLLGTVLDDPDTSGTQYTLLECVGALFLTNGVRAKDTVRALYTTSGNGVVTYTSFVVDEVINEETIRLVTGPSIAINVAAKFEIHRTLTRNELAADLAAYPGLFNSRRAYLVWPDEVGNAGLTFPGYFLCAALAGLRSGVLPHQGLTNVSITGFDDLTRTTKFLTGTQMNTMAASGYWLVTQDYNDGTIYTRHELTCGDQTDVNQREQNITTNLDHISYIFLNRLKSYIGRGNVSDAMLTIIQGDLISIIEEFKNTISSSILGPQINEAEIIELAQHPTFKDRIVCRILLTLPAPLNNLELHLIVQ